MPGPRHEVFTFELAGVADPGGGGGDRRLAPRVDHGHRWLVPVSEILLFHARRCGAAHLDLVLRRYAQDPNLPGAHRPQPRAGGVRCLLRQNGVATSVDHLDRGPAGVRDRRRGRHRRRLLARNPLLSAIFDPYIKMLNALPRVVLAPIFMLWLGLGIWSKVALGVTLVFFIVFFNVYQGVKEVSPIILANARMLGMNKRQLF